MYSIHIVLIDLTLNAAGVLCPRRDVHLPCAFVAAVPGSRRVPDPPLEPGHFSCEG